MSPDPNWLRRNGRDLACERCRITFPRDSCRAALARSCGRAGASSSSEACGRKNCDARNAYGPKLGILCRQKAKEFRAAYVSRSDDSRRSAQKCHFIEKMLLKIIRSCALTKMLPRSCRRRTIGLLASRSVRWGRGTMTPARDLLVLPKIGLATGHAFGHAISRQNALRLSTQ